MAVVSKRGSNRALFHYVEACAVRNTPVFIFSVFVPEQGILKLLSGLRNNRDLLIHSERIYGLSRLAPQVFARVGKGVQNFNENHLASYYLVRRESASQHH